MTRQISTVVCVHPALSGSLTCTVDGSLSFELEHSPDPDKLVEWVAEAYNTTDELMRQIGPRG